MSFRVLGGLVTVLLLSSCGGTLNIPRTPVAGELLATATPGLPSQATSVAPGDATSIPPVDLPTIPVDVPSAVSEPEPTPLPPPELTPTVIPALANIAIAQPAELEQRWRAQQVDRVVLETPAIYAVTGAEMAEWFDPVTGMRVPVGELRGEFTVQATFRIKGEWAERLEIPFNATERNYGITVPSVIAERMKIANGEGWCEVFIYRTGDTQPR